MVAEDTHALTVRLSRDQADRLALLARLEGRSVAEAVRVAIAEYITRTSADANVRERLGRHASTVRDLLNGG